jgi:biotin carboxyl carrier protein
MLVSERRESVAAGAGGPIDEAGAAGKATQTISHDVTITPDVNTGQVQVRVGTATVAVTLNGRRASRRKEEAGHSGAGPQRLLAPMPGKIVRLLVSAGDAVQARQPIAVIEAMKMENEIRAGRDGIVSELPVAAGQSVDAGTLVAVITAQTG